MSHIIGSLPVSFGYMFATRLAFSIMSRTCFKENSGTFYDDCNIVPGVADDDGEMESGCCS